MLVEHRVDDVDERLVAIEEAVPAREQVTFQPALALVLAQHFHYPSGGREEFVVGYGGALPLTVGRLKEGFEAVRERLVRAEHTEISLLAVSLFHIAQETPQHMCIADAAYARRGHLDRVIAEIRHPEIVEQHAAVSVGIRAHTPVTFGRKVGKFRSEAALFI